MDQLARAGGGRRTWPTIHLGRPQVPSWLLSMGFHLILFILLAFMLQIAPRQGAMAERTADVGIVLKHQQGKTEYFEGPDDVGQAVPAASVAAAGASLAEMFDDRPPINPSSALPAPMGIIGPSALADGGTGNAGASLDGPAGRPNTYGGKAKASVFGVEGEGYKFVYVFDRSASMGGSGRNALSAAKAELIRSLESLGTTHQFQIIFYNETPTVFNPSGRPGRLAFADEQTKRRAEAFVSQIIADGTTRHEEALLKAISLQPDVIFFLTDADEPRLSAGQLYDIQRRAAGITISAIEFGLGPKASRGNFLEKLAQQNGGQYAYVDITRLATGRGTP
jgi:hypothetical protein